MHIFKTGPRLVLPSKPPWYTCEWTGGINGNVHTLELD